MLSCCSRLVTKMYVNSYIYKDVKLDYVHQCWMREESEVHISSVYTRVMTLPVGILIISWPLTVWLLSCDPWLSGCYLVTLTVWLLSHDLWLSGYYRVTLTVWLLSRDPWLSGCYLVTLTVWLLSRDLDHCSLCKPNYSNYHAGFTNISSIATTTQKTCNAKVWTCIANTHTATFLGIRQ